MSVLAPVLAPGATIGILGGGQLGRMLALAAARLGFKCHVFAPNPDSPAFDVVHRVTCADYDDTQALDRFAADVDVVTYEFENVPAETATFLAARVPVLPDPKVLATTQDRLAEKNFVAGARHPHRALCRGRRAVRTCSRARPDRPAGGAEDAAVRLRRQRPGDHRQRHRSRGGVARGRRPALHRRSLRAVRARGLRRRRARQGRRVECFDVSENEHRDAHPARSRACRPTCRRRRRTQRGA